MRSFKRFTVLSCLLGVLVHALPAIAADPVPPMTFGASVTNANGLLSTQLSWSAVSATTCVGSGHPAWDGAKAVSGTQALPPITMSGTYTLTLNCTRPGDTSAVLAWTAPTQNTDGSDLTDLAGYKVYHGITATALTDVVSVGVSTPTEYTFSALTEGPHYFAVSAVNAAGVESDRTSPVTKVIVATVSQSAAVTLTVNPKPSQPGNLTVR